MPSFVQNTPMVLDRKALLQEMKELTETSIQTAQTFVALDIAPLLRKPTPESWNALQCLDHLNRYSDYYIPAIDNCMAGAKATGQPERFRTGWLGGYFAALMKGKQGRIQKMKTPKAMEPVTAQLSLDTVHYFLEQQRKLLVQIEKAAHSDLRKRLPISLSTLVRLQLGDVFRFYVYHIERHLNQAKKAAGLS